MLLVTVLGPGGDALTAAAVAVLPLLLLAARGRP
jgi:hypothetical protein